MRVFVVDDEPFARQSIITIVNDRFPNVKIVGEASSVKSAVDQIKKLKPDLVFMDIDLTDGSGFDVLNFLKPIQFKIIFVTAHHEFAIKAIKFSALDYILKPISSFELESAMTRAIQEEVTENSLKLDAFENNLNANNTEKKIVLKTSDSIHLININNIIRCEADNNYTTFFTSDEKKIVISKGLKEYDDMLSAYGFFRVHQSHLINTKYMVRFDKKDGGFVVLSDNSIIPVSQRKKQRLLEIFEEYS